MDRIAYSTVPTEWTQQGAVDQLDYFRRLPAYKQGRTRPWSMWDIAGEAQVATMEVLERVHAGSKAKRRHGELLKVLAGLEVRWRQYAVLPVLIRSDEHKIALVQAAWAIKNLRDAMELWSV